MLLPLDEAPVHVHRFAARAPCDSKGSDCQCGIHRAEAASALRSRKTERAAKEKPTPISQFFLAPAVPWHPNSPPRPGEAPHRAPSARKSVIRLHRKLPSAPLRAPRRFRNPKIGQQLGAQPTPRYRWRYRWRFRRCFSRSTRLPFTSTPSPPAPLAIRKAPSASVESIQPRPPQPCEVGRPKGRRRKNRRQSHTFFLAPAAPGPPNPPATPWGGSPPRPLCQKICYSDCTKNCPLRPLRAPRRFRNPKIGQPATPRFRVMIEALLEALLEGVIDPWPPFGPAKVGRPKGRRRKSRRQSHNFFLAPAAHVF